MIFRGNSLIAIFLVFFSLLANPGPIKAASASGADFHFPSLDCKKLFGKTAEQMKKQLGKPSKIEGREFTYTNYDPLIITLGLDDVGNLAGKVASIEIRRKDGHSEVDFLRLREQVEKWAGLEKISLAPVSAYSPTMLEGTAFLGKFKVRVNILSDTFLLRSSS